MHLFGGRLYLGFSDTGGNKPYLVALTTMPSSPGLDAVPGVSAFDLRATDFPGWGGTSFSMIDAMTDFNDRLYVANADGCMATTTTSPRNAKDFPGDWASCTPATSDYTALASSVTMKVAGFDPADRAIPRLVAFNGRLYLARNTTVGPQLFVCVPSVSGDPQRCDPGDFALIARNSQGNARLTQLNDAGNTRITFLAATADHLYIGFDNASGVQIYRSRVAQPSLRSHFEGLGGCTADLHPASCAPYGGAGFGQPSSNTRIFDGIATQLAGRDHVYVVTGDGTNAVSVWHLAD
jgi:hypothetical protein